MAVNLIDMVKSQLGNQVVGQIAGLLGESSDKTQSAINGAIPALLGGLMNNASNSSGAGNLLNALNSVDDGMVGNFAGMLGGSQSKGVMDMGGRLLGNVLGGGGLNNMIGAVSGFSGLGKGAAGSLLGLLAPLLMGTVKRQLMGSGGLNVGNLTNLLMGQKSNIAAAMPRGFDTHLKSAGLGDMLGGVLGSATAAGQQAVSSASRAVGSAANTAANTATTAARGGGNILRWLLPLIILAALAFFFLNRGGRNAVQDATNAAGNAASAATNAVGDAATAATDAAGDAVNAAGDAVANAGGAFQDAVVGDVNVGTEINNVFGSATDILNGIKDEATATEALPRLTELDGKIGELSGLFGQLGDAGKGAVATAVQNSTTGLQALVDKVSALPGVGDVIKSILDSILQKLAAFTA
jgi:hypothetical protein